MSSQSTVSDPDGDAECPVCQATMLDRSFDMCTAICEACGLVIHDFSTDFEAELVAETGELSEGGSTLSWAEFCTVRNATEHQVAVAIEEIELVGDELRITPEVREATAQLYVDAMLADLTDGRPTDVIVAACIVLGGRQASAIRPLQHVAESLGMDSDSVGKYCRLLQRELGLNLNPPTPQDYSKYLCRQLGFSSDIRRRVDDLLADAAEASIGIGKDPAGVAGAALYLITDGASSQRAIGTAAGVTGETIRVRVRELREGL